VLLGGIQTLVGPLVGAATFNLLQDTIMRSTEYWRALFGGIILLLVLVFPQGIAGFCQQIAERIGLRRSTPASRHAALGAAPVTPAGVEENRV
jgi:branched-chain amino acid transport system permease protein